MLIDWPLDLLQIVSTPRLGVIFLKEWHFEQIHPAALSQSQAVYISNNCLVNELWTFMSEHCIVVEDVSWLQGQSEILLIEEPVCNSNFTAHNIVYFENLLILFLNNISHRVSSGLKSPKEFRHMPSELFVPVVKEFRFWAENCNLILIIDNLIILIGLIW